MERPTAHRRLAMAGIGVGLACLAAAGACASGGGPAASRAPATPQAPAARTAPPAQPPPPRQSSRARPADVETYRVAAAEISSYLLESMVGIATISAGTTAGGAAGDTGGQRDQRGQLAQSQGARGDDEATPAIYDNDGDRFIEAGHILLRDTRPISSFRVGTAAIVKRSRAIVRRYAVLDSKGAFVKVALEPSGRRSAWLRRTPEGAFPDSVVFLDLKDAASFRCYQLDLFFLAGGAPRKLFAEPQAQAPFTLLPAPGRGAGGAGTLGADFVPLARRGNFIQVAAVRSIDDPRTAAGWVELRDGKGRLTVWFALGPEC